MDLTSPCYFLSSFIGPVFSDIRILDKVAFGKKLNFFSYN